MGGKQKSQQQLTPLELQIMNVLWDFGPSNVQSVQEKLAGSPKLAYTTVQTLVYRLEQKGALRRVKKIGNAQLFEPAIDQREFRSRLVRDLLDLFGGSPRLLVSNLLETGTITLKDLKALQGALPKKAARSRGGKSHA